MPHMIDHVEQIFLETVRLVDPQQNCNGVDLAGSMEIACAPSFVEDCTPGHTPIQSRPLRSLHRRIEYVKIHRVLGDSWGSVCI